MCIRDRLRVIQEACSNSIKHGHAKEINVSLKYEPKSLTLTIKDDGDGFDTSAIPEFTRDDNSGFGLSMMKERIYLLSGKISILSKPGEGCIAVSYTHLDDQYQAYATGYKWQ